ncbi:MAG: hypothetical protein K8F91_06430, partial [Candidatus Obscuribacterales bacterium]|nr:hypothetical protein [Candidatus Obscuribacterales bacterium]
MKSSPQGNKKRSRAGAGIFPERRHCLAFRSQRGSILPLIAFLLALVVAFLALTVDVMRTVHTIDKVQSAVEAAALAAMYKATNVDPAAFDGTAFDAAARAAINDELAKISNWNQAPSGPTSSGGAQETNIAIDTGSTEFYPNPQDTGSPQEFFLRVTGRRDGADSLTMMFLPAIFAFNSWAGLPVPPGISQVSPYRQVEVICQPAARIGAGTTAQPYASSAAFPFVLARSEFEMPVNNNKSVSQPVDLIDKNGNGSTSTNLKGGFVNVYHAGSDPYYGTAEAGNIDQLGKLLEFFADNPPASALAPGIVERGSELYLFDPTSTDFKAAIQNGGLK